MQDHDRIASVIEFLDRHHQEQPGLDRLAAHVGLSPHHFHRLFVRWAGITPKAFLQCLTLEHARHALRAGASVLDAALDVGLSGPGRLHDLCVRLEAASPGEIKAGGAGWTIDAGIAETPFGRAQIATSPRGLCHFSFLDDGERDEATLRIDWPRAAIDWRLDAERLAAHVFAPEASDGEPLRVLVRGSEFQVRVWRALLRVPTGALTSYGQLATAIGEPDAARAVGTAVGSNRLAYLIPCHRVIRATGAIGAYRWGSDRKRAMIAWEGARRTDVAAR